MVLFLCVCERQKDVEMKRCRRAEGKVPQHCGNFVSVFESLSEYVVVYREMNSATGIGDWNAGQNIYAGCPDKRFGIHLPHPQCHDNRVFIF